MSYLSFVQTEIANKPTFTPLTAQDMESILRSIYGLNKCSPENALTKLNYNWQEQNPAINWLDISECFREQNPVFGNDITDKNKLFLNMMLGENVYGYNHAVGIYKVFRHDIARSETLYAQIDKPTKYADFVADLDFSQRQELKTYIGKIMKTRFEICNPNCSEIVDEAVKMYLENQQNSLFLTCITIAQDTETKVTKTEIEPKPETRTNTISWRQGFLPRCKSGVHFALQIKLNNKIIK